MKLRLISKEILIFLVIWVSVILFWKNNLLLTFIFFILWGVLCYFWNSRNYHTIFSFGAILGSTTEIIGTHSGAWKYTDPVFWGIPLWLPVGWGIAAVLIARLVKIL